MTYYPTMVHIVSRMVVSGCRARMAIGTACIGAHERGRGERIGSMEQQRAEPSVTRL